MPEVAEPQRKDPVEKADDQAKERDPHGIGNAGAAADDGPAAHPTDDRHQTEHAATKGS